MGIDGLTSMGMHMVMTRGMSLGMIMGMGIDGLTSMGMSMVPLWEMARWNRPSPSPEL